MPEYSNGDLSYAAGFIDGEGSFIIARRKERPGTYLMGVQHIPKITAANTDTRPLYFLKTLFGGSVCMVKRRRPQHAQGYLWTVGNKTAIQTARLLEPFLKVKQEQARILICYKDDALWHRGGNKEIIEPEYNRRERLTTEIRRLNGN